jgi:iron(III) transport system substrate-binding protein
MRSVLLLVSVILLAGCGDSGSRDQVVIYTSVDQHFSEPLLQRFQEETGIEVKAVYDVEANKTTGLVNRIISERASPKADVFWNGEYSQTLLLADQGLLAPYHSPQSSRALWRDPYNLWSAFGGRIRVLIINREAMGENPVPNSIFDLVDDRWPAHKVGLALPLFGTSATHAAALWDHLGASAAIDYFLKLKTRGVNFLDGNSVVRDKVASGELWFGLTDSDDACGAAARGQPVSISFPDQQGEGMGTLVIPNSVALISGAPNAGHGRRLIDYLLSSAAEELLSGMGWFHLASGKVSSGSECSLPGEIRIFETKPQAVNNSLGSSSAYLRELLLR